MKSYTLLAASAMLLLAFSCKKSDDATNSSPLPEPDVSAAVSSRIAVDTELSSTEVYPGIFARSLEAPLVASSAQEFIADQSRDAQMRQNAQAVNQLMIDVGFDNFDHSQVYSAEGNVFYAAYEQVNNNQEIRENCFSIIQPGNSSVLNYEIIEGPFVVGLALTSQYLANQRVPASIIQDIMFPVTFQSNGAPSYDSYGSSLFSYKSEMAFVEVLFTVEDREVNNRTQRVGVSHITAIGCLETNGSDCKTPIDIDHTWVFPIDWKTIFLLIPL